MKVEKLFFFLSPLWERSQAVDDMIPPMTTVANGRCASAPCPVAKTIGTNERMALVIEASRINIRNKTGGPFAAAIFEKDSCEPFAKVSF